mmetsp:Transcript_2174/g.3273  ORF Transcript_2174/g.3273 Transcript_2174/m.3273 type:complete len:634 (-) Transcript_2174:283-2184(-)
MSDVNKQDIVEDVNINPGLEKSKTKLWIEQWKLILKKEDFIHQELQPLPSLLQSQKDIWEQEEARKKSFLVFRAKTWSEVQRVQSTVDEIYLKLADAPSKSSSFVTSLAQSIDAADAAIAAFRRTQIESRQSLLAEELDIDRELTDVLARIESEIADSFTDTKKHSVFYTNTTSNNSGDGKNHSTLNLNSKGTTNGPVQSLLRPRPFSAAVAREYSENVSSLRSPSSSSSSSFSIARPRSVDPYSKKKKPGFKASGHPEPRTLDPDVKAFENFILKFGPTGGWDPEDHAEFEKIVRQCKGDYVKVIGIVRERSVGFTREEIQHHSRWHMDYLDLLIKKREALDKWKKRRDEERSRCKAKVAAGEDGEDGVGNDDDTEGEDDSDGDSRYDRGIDKRRSKRLQRTKEEIEEAKRAQNEKKELIAVWKALKEEQQRDYLTTVTAVQKEEEARKKLMEAKREAENRSKIEIYRKEKADKAVAATAMAAMARGGSDGGSIPFSSLDGSASMSSWQHGSDSAASIASSSAAAAAAEKKAAAAARVAARNEATLERRRKLETDRKVALRDREIRQEEFLKRDGVMHKAADPDPERLLKSTASARQRVEITKAEERQAKDSGFILQVAHRITPGWATGAGM